MKPMIRYSAILILITAGLVYFGCQKRSERSIELGPGQVEATVTGRITDNSNIPVENATVKAGYSTAKTDIDGKFTLKNVALDANSGFIKVEKEGFFLGSRTITVKPNGNNYVAIQLIKKVSAGNFNGSSGGSVNVSNGGKISFDAGGVIVADSKSPYGGTVNVDAFFINPTANNFKEIMPGALKGVTSSNVVTGLQSFGMMAVELTGSGNQKLQIAQGKTATITFPIATDLLAQAPATIPLWSFDETTGLWKEEGMATKTGANYVGTVSHFSFWNCDAPFVTIKFNATIKDKNNKPIVGARVVIKTSGDKISLSGYDITDNEGHTGGLIPANQNLELEIYNPCGALISTQNIGPYSKDIDLGTLNLDNPEPTKLTISGNVVNCSGGVVSDGFVNIAIEGFNYRTSLSKGNFSITIDRCVNSSVNAQIIAADLASSQQSAVRNVTVSSGNTNVGQLQACGNSTDQFINFTIGTTDYHLIDPIDSLLGYRANSNSYIEGAPKPQGTQGSSGPVMGFGISSITTGTASGFQLYVYLPNKSYREYGAINVKINEYGNVGEYIAGTVSANLRQDSTNNPQTVPFSGTFRVRRIR